MARLTAGYSFCVFEVQRRSGLVVVDASMSTAFPATFTPCWNLLYSINFNPDDEEETKLAHQACEAWLENNHNGTSKYAIIDLLLYESSS